jgi:hypothetical protein
MTDLQAKALSGWCILFLLIGVGITKLGGWW